MIKIVKEYTEKRLELLKLEATEQSLKAIGISVPLVIIAVFAIFFLILLNIGIALLLGNWLHNFAYGFFAMAGFYFILMLIMYLLRNTIKNVITDKSIALFFND